MKQIRLLDKNFNKAVEEISKYNSNPQNVFSNIRSISYPSKTEIKGLKYNQKQKMDGLKLLKMVLSETIPLVFLTLNIGVF